MTSAASQTPVPIGRAGPNPWLVLARGIAGGVLGGIAGYFVFRSLAVRGMLGYAIPAASIGFGAGLFSRGKSDILATLCVLAGLCLTIYLEWSAAPFRKDPSLSYFVTHLYQLDGAPIKFIITVLGLTCSYWLARGR